MKDAFRKAFPALADALGSANIDVLLQAVRPVALPAERVLFRDRMPVESLYLILEGRLGITVGEGEHTLSLGESTPGEWLGEVSVLSGSMAASATVTTLTPCRALKLHYQDFDRLIRDNDEIANALLSNLINLLAARLRTSSAATGRAAEA